MIRNSIVSKLSVTIIGMVVVVLTLLGTLLQQFFDNYVYLQQSRQLNRLAVYVQALVETNSFDFSKKVAQQLSNVQNAQIIFSVPYTANSSLNTRYHHLTLANQQKLTDGGAITVRNMHDGNGTISVYMLIPAQPHPGMLAVTQQLSISNREIVAMRNLILFAMALGVLLTTGLAFVVSKNLSRPLLQMNEVAERMAKGRFDSQIEVSTNDEVGRLGRTFNAMANELAQTIAAFSMEKDQLSSILASLEDGVVAADLDGHITLANPPAVRRLSSLILEESGDLDIQKLPPGLRELMTSVIAQNRTEIRQVTWIGRDFVVTMTPLYEPDGETVRGTVSVLRDVTEERRLDRLRKDFIANVSHELRTPLSMMQGYAEALMDDFGDDPKQRAELTEIIHDETLRMRRLVNDLLSLAQLESGKFQMNFGEIDLAALLNRVFRRFQGVANERQIVLGSNLASAPLRVKADPDRIEQVFVNLLDNAIRHTEKGGHVTIEARCTKQHAQVRVSDTGSGIMEEDLPYIWERFYKGDKARTRGSSGTGLGLSITRHIVLEHGGNIFVESTVGKGTTFTVILPLFIKIEAADL